MTAADPAGGYRAEPAALPRDRDTVLALWRGNLGDPARHAGKFDWFYRGDPFGPSLLQLLRHGDTVVGTCGAAARRMLWQGREIRAGLLADMAVDARHRTLGPALMLQEALIAAAASQRFDLLYGFPNRKSLPVVRRLGYTVLGELSRHARVLRHARYLQQRMPRWLAVPLGGVLDVVRAAHDGLRALPRRGVTAAWSEQADPRMDALWNESPHGEGLLGVHDAAMARWRFDASPLAGVRYLLLADRCGALHAWFACETRDGVLHVRDYWSQQGVDGIDYRLVLALLRAAQRAGCASVTLECAAAPERMVGWRRAGFVLREGQPVVGKWLGDGPAPLDLAQGWHLTEADADE